MTPVLMVDAEHARASRVASGLEDAGLDVRHVGCGLEALTAIERLRPDVVVTRWRIGRLTAQELAAVLRRDEDVGDLRMVLLVEPEHRAVAVAAASAFDLVTDGGEDADGGLGERIARLAGDPRPRDPGGAADGKEDFSISGHFGLLDLADLVQTVCSRRKSGTLALACGSHTGSVVFEAGLVRHACYRGAEGRPAFARLAGELRDCGRAPFSFTPLSPADIRATPCTIGDPPQLLLLDVAIAQDESRRRLELAGRPGARPDGRLG